MKKKRILVTGGAGYIGSVLSDYLLNQGHHVTCLDSLIYGQHPSQSLLNNRDYIFIYGDVRDEKLLEELVPKCDVVIPLAGLVGMPICEKYQIDARQINQDAVVKINDIRSRDQILLFPTTNSGYGNTDGSLFCTEETPLKPISTYGETKSAAEKALHDSGKDVVTFRLATVFGLSSRMRLDLLVNDFTFRACRDKELRIFEKNFKRNFVHIKDVANVFYHAVNNFISMKQKKVYNVGLPDANISKWELAERIKKYVPNLVIKEEEGRDPDQRNYIVSNDRLLSTGFIFNYSLDFGINEMVEEFNNLNKDSVLSTSNNHNLILR